MLFELSRMEFEVLAIHGKARLDSLNDQLALLEIPLPRKIELISDLARFAVKVNTNNRSRMTFRLFILLFALTPPLLLLIQQKIAQCDVPFSN